MISFTSFEEEFLGDDYYHSTTRRMVPFQLCYHFYASIIVLTLVGGTSAFIVTVMSICGVGSIELIVILSLSLFYVVMRLLLAPWTDSDNGLDQHYIFLSSSMSHHQQQEDWEKSIQLKIKTLAIDTYICDEAWVATLCSCNDNYTCTTTTTNNNNNDNKSNNNNNDNKFPGKQQQCSKTCDKCTTCPICLTSFESGDTISRGRSCQHAFHCDCLQLWLKHGHTSCPYCRQEFQLHPNSCHYKKTGILGIIDGIFDSIYS